MEYHPRQGPQVIDGVGLDASCLDVHVVVDDCLYYRSSRTSTSPTLLARLT
jgi:hypothetical protein